MVHDRRALDVRHASPEQGLSFAQNRLGETCTSHVCRASREPDVSRGRKCVQVGLRNASPEQGLSFAQNRLGETCTSHVCHVNHAMGVHHGRKCVLGGRREFREVRGRRSETCCGGPEVLGSSRDACRHRQLGEHRVSHESRVTGVRHDRRCAERGLPNVMKVRQFLLRVACVDRGRRLPKHPCGELI